MLILVYIAIVGFVAFKSYTFGKEISYREFFPIIEKIKFPLVFKEKIDFETKFWADGKKYLLDNFKFYCKFWANVLNFDSSRTFDSFRTNYVTASVLMQVEAALISDKIDDKQ